MSNQEAFDFLQGAFPQLTNSQITKALDDSGQNLDLAMGFLLSLHVEDHDDVQDDDAYARALQLQFDDEFSSYSALDPHIDRLQDEQLARELAKEFEVFSPKPVHRPNEFSGFEGDVEEDILGGILNANFGIQDIIQSGLISADQFQTMLDQIKQSLTPLLREQLQNLSITNLDESFEVPKLGPVDFSMSNLDESIDHIRVKSFDIPEENLQIRVNGNNIEFTAARIRVGLDKFAWRFKQKNFPKLKDKGKATAHLNGLSINVQMGIGNLQSSSPIKVLSCVVEIDKFDVKISGNNKKIVYNIAISAASRILKTRIEQLLATLISEEISLNAGKLVDGFAM